MFMLPRYKAAKQLGAALPRNTPLLPSTVDALRRWKAWRRREAADAELRSGRHGHEYADSVFTNDKRCPYKSEKISHAFARLAKVFGKKASNWRPKHLRNVGEDYLVALVNLIGAKYFDGEQIAVAALHCVSVYRRSTDFLRVRLPKSDSHGGAVGDQFALSALCGAVAASSDASGARGAVGAQPARSRAREQTSGRAVLAEEGPRRIPRSPVDLTDTRRRCVRFRLRRPRAVPAALVGPWRDGSVTMEDGTKEAR